MKFEKFVKRVGSRGMLLKDGSGKWICDGNVAMVIPAGVNVAYSTTVKMPQIIGLSLDNTEFPADNGGGALLVAAKLDPDGKAKDIQRIYKENGDEIAISNADWSLIESGDRAKILYDIDGQIIGLVIFSGYGDNTEIVGVIFAEYFNIYEAIREEKNNNGN